MSPAAPVAQEADALQGVQSCTFKPVLSGLCLDVPHAKNAHLENLVT